MISITHNMSFHTVVVRHLPIDGVVSRVPPAAAALGFRPQDLSSSTQWMGLRQRTAKVAPQYTSVFPHLMTEHKMLAATMQNDCSINQCLGKEHAVCEQFY